jgi:hypothetical protein
MAAFCMVTGEKTMTTQRTLADLKEALQQPFAPETIQFLPKEIRKENGNLVCLALPYANKRVYEDRLNALVFGEWSTPYTPPYSQGNKLMIPVTVVVLGVPHTDYGEAFFEVAGKNGTTREDENTATEAYSQAFRRACAQFLLGRYLYDLPKLTLPYDSQARRVAVSKAERIDWVEKLYQAQGLLPKVYTMPTKPTGVSASTQTTQESAATPATSAAQQQTIKTSPAQEKTAASSTTSATQQKVLTTTPQQQRRAQPTTTASAPQQKVVKESQSTPKQPTSYPNDTFLDWVAISVERDPKRVQDICDFYHIAALAQLSETQRKELTKRLRWQASQQRQQTHAASSALASH